MDESFDARVARMVKVSTRKESFKYWSPAIVGGAIACLALMASLQLLSRTTEPRVNPRGEAFNRSVHTPSSASLTLDRIPTIR